ncbi:hypothetical protein PPERSA_10880 [Pseudocohnilembus persalinus]|uniref:Uncharacterized protein n=1 Tax=Pseudocohnilembus persalinus TaxID=266149 RepID=A0A0V0R6S3_PSEPJ|nr:hypothetical protein PPERSA_10880 [Pseudocohnilembus persalinus]|eukprot:KRX10214.1 hypothetical protein PPERSA_10880 [Pseudocohnilembus persalinus]
MPNFQLLKSKQMTFYNADEEIPGEALQQNDDVELNYLRVRGADVIQQCMQKAEQGQYEEGQKLIKNIQVDIDKARPENRKKLQMLYNDLQESEQTCNKDRYQQEGKFRMITQNKAHMEKRSRNLKSKKAANFSQMPQQMDQMRLDSEEEQQDMYQNCIQQQMVFSRVQKKKQK